MDRVLFKTSSLCLTGSWSYSVEAYRRQHVNKEILLASVLKACMESQGPLNMFCVTVQSDSIVLTNKCINC